MADAPKSKTDPDNSVDKADTDLIFILLGVFLCCANVQGYDIFPNQGFRPFDFQSGKWRGRLGAIGGFRSPGLSTEGEGTGWVNTRRDFGVDIGVGYRFRRGATSLPDDRFHLRIEASPCQFLVYDRNTDGEIIREEVRDVSPDANLAEKLFRELDSTTGDDIITREEFYYMTPKLIYGCDSGVLEWEPEPIPRESQQPKGSVTAEVSDGKTDETSDDNTEE